MTDQTQVIPAARRLLGLGAFHGAAVVLFNAKLAEEAQRNAALSAWTPDGFLPLRRQPQPHLHASNDHVEPSNLTA